MNPRAGDGGYVDDGAFGGFELLQQAAREHDRCEEVHPEHMVPDIDGGIDRGQARAAVGLGRDRGVVDEGMQFAGNGWREQVMTRHPAAENRLTVAWPMPRLAPVSKRARRGWFECGVAMKIKIPKPCQC